MCIYIYIIYYVYVYIIYYVYMYIYILYNSHELPTLGPWNLPAPGQQALCSAVQNTLHEVLETMPQQGPPHGRGRRWRMVL